MAALIADGLEPATPIADQKRETDDTQTERQIRHHPGDAIESAARRRDEHCGAIFLDKRLQSEVIALPAVYARSEFAAHAVGVGATHVVAFQQHLIASANAHQLVTESVKADVISRAHGQ